jgi:hypothetical protein
MDSCSLLHRLLPTLDYSLHTVYYPLPTAHSGCCLLDAFKRPNVKTCERHLMVVDF